MADFYLKYRDTRPIIEVTLLDPDDAPYDLTNTDNVYLHIYLNNGTTVSKTMSINVDPTTGKASYTWQSTDWDAGGLVKGRHRMEYEAVTGTTRLTFPNDSYDTLNVKGDIADGA